MSSPIRITTSDEAIVDVSSSLQSFASPPIAADEQDFENWSSLLPPNPSPGPGVQRIAGSAHIVTVVRSQAYVEARIGPAPRKGFPLATLWSAVSSSSQTSDALLSYDPARNRWVIAATVDAGLSTSGILLAVSENDDPTGLWRVYRLEPERHQRVWASTPSISFRGRKICVDIRWHAFAPGTIQATPLLNSPEWTDSYLIDRPQSATTDSSMAMAVGPPTPAAVAAVVVPQPTSVSPNSGQGGAQAFYATYTDANGNNAITQATLLINSTLNGSGACYVMYTGGGSNQLYLVNDAGNGTVGSVTFGSSAAVSNSQCTLNGNGSYLSTSGSQLSFNAALTFAPAFAGSKAIYMFVADASGSNSGWQVKGTWAVPTIGVTPTTDYLSPDFGQGATQGFYTTYSDINGYPAITQALLLINSTLDGAGACYVMYTGGGSNQLYLVNDAGNGTVGSVTFGSSAVVSNSQCTLNGNGSYLNTSGSQLSFNAALTFAPAFGGTKTIFMYAAAGPLNSGWQAKGAWTVPGSVPQTLSVSPNSGHGLPQIFSASYSDINGYPAITQALLLINSTLDGAGACYVMYTGGGSNQLYLVNDAGNGIAGSVTFGSSAVVSNSQCTLNGNGSYLNTSGSQLSFNAALTFAPAFGGTKTIFMYAAAGPLNSGWRAMGSWTVPTVNVSASPDSVFPNSGEGSSQSFYAIYKAINGYGAITQALMLINSTLNSASSCWVAYFGGGSNVLYLLNDAGLWSPVTFGSSNTVSNSQCTLHGNGSYLYTSGTQLSFNANLSFTPAFEGNKVIYMYAAAGALNSGWQALGSWITP